MKKLLIFVLTLTLLPIASYAQGNPTSVCLVTHAGGRINDRTFNQFAYEGMTRAAEDFNLRSTVIETNSPSDHAENLRMCVREGYQIVVSIGLVMADPTYAVAEENPDVYFIGVDHFVMNGPANYIGIQFREDQGGFLVGALAGMATESNIIGGVYGAEVPPILRFSNGYQQGAEYVAIQLEKDIEVKTVYTGTFQEPDIGRSTAAQLIGDGADVIFGAGGQTGSGAIQEGAEQAVWVIGVDQDEYNTTFGEGEVNGAEYVISSAIKRVDLGVYDMIEALTTGNMDAFPGGGNHILSIQNEGITFAPAHDADLPDCYYQNLEALQTALNNEDLQTGVNPQSGDLETPAEELAETYPFSNQCDASD